MTDTLSNLWHTITRERAVLAGLALAILEAVQRGEITKATAVPVLAGFVLRFFVSPYYYGDHYDVPGPDGIAH